MLISDSTNKKQASPLHFAILCTHNHGITRIIIILSVRIINIERLTIKSQALKWYFLNKVRKCILDIFWTQLEFFEPWKLHDKKSIVIGAQKRSIELVRFKLLWYIAGLFFLNGKWLVLVFWQHVIWQRYSACLQHVSWQDIEQMLDPSGRHT